MTNTVNYEVLLPAMAAALRSKKDDDRQINDDEFKKIVAVTYRDSVIGFMRDSLLYTEMIPIDFYKGVKRYEIIPPEGYTVEATHRIRYNNFKSTKGITFDNENVYLQFTPKCDIDLAVYAEVALVQRMFNEGCEFSKDFVEKYYDAIKAHMLMTMFAMTERSWNSLTQYQFQKREYRTALNKAKRMALNGGAPIKLSFRKMSEY